MTTKEILKQVSEELNIPYEVVNKVYSSYWKFIRSKIIDLPLKENLTKEEFEKLKVNFNLPSLGKLNCTYKRLLGLREKEKLMKKYINGRF